MRLTVPSRSRKALIRVIVRWAIYSAFLMLFFVMECAPLIPGFCPLLIIPLATTVAMCEGDLAAGIFGAVCGLMLDIAKGAAVTGFSALLLMFGCVFISLMSRFLIMKTFLSHLIMNAGICVIMAGLDMIFLHWVWEGSQSIISFRKIILPSYGGGIFWSVPIYILISHIVTKLKPKEQQKLAESAQNAEDEASDG